MTAKLIDVQTQKQVVRQSLFGLRKRFIAENNMPDITQKLCFNFKKYLEKNNTILNATANMVSYSPLSDEADVVPINAFCEQCGVNVILVEPCKTASLPQDDFKIAVIPTVGFDRDGNRIGRGAGWYDRFLRTCAKKTLKIGIAFSVQEVCLLPVNEFDVKLDAIITEKEIIEIKV